MPHESFARKARSALVTLIPGTAARRKAIADLTARNIELAASVHERSILKAELAECRAGRAACETVVSERDRRITSLGGEIDDLLGEIAHLRAREDLTDELREAQAQRAAADALRSLREAAAEHVRYGRDAALRQPILDFLALLAPHRVEDVAMIRVGRERDGGYIMLDDFAEITAALSCGIADETSWDRAIAERGIPVVQVDDSVDAPPDSHPLWTFHRRRVSAAATSAATITLRELIGLCPGSGDTLLAKIDIEGSEWEALPPAIDSLARCRQLVIEFHDFDRLADPLWRSAATAVLEAVVVTHCPVHVHGNNFEPLVVLGGVPVPKVCEVTFALRSRYRLVPAPGLVPTAMDCPNNPESADLHFALRYPTG